MTPSATDPQQNAQSVFARDVLQGLSKHPKTLPSKYFYDERGDKLFQDIMNMPEYYLTDCEREIFELHRSALLETIGRRPFDLIELGAGDGSKTKILLRHFLEREADFRYRPIDISGNVLRHLESDLQKSLPELQVESLRGDYFKMLHRLQNDHDHVKVVLFLGANIGNYTPQQALDFLRAIATELNPGDFLLVGFDLKKDPAVILRAYNDPAGITAAFNLNLLTRMNRELGAEFVPSAFKHWETYDPVTGATRSYLVSLKEQNIYFSGLNRSFRFAAWEAVNVELSQKYSLKEVEAMAAGAGFRVKEHFFDRKDYFMDSLWQI